MTQMPGEAEPHGWMFDAFRLDLRDERLWRGEAVIHLNPKAFAVLRCLVSQAGQLVTKDALLETVWPETAVSESVLQVAIRELRRAVGDSGRTQQVIQTVHGRGYRFIAAVEEELDEAEPPSASPSAPVIPSGAWLAGSDFREAERRQLTVLVCRLVGRPERTTPLDPETLLEVLPPYHTLCAEVVRRFGGHMAQDQGDSLIVYFGYPQAHEDDACRAVYTGLEIVEAMRQLQASRIHDEAERFAIRLGVHTGLVVISGLGLHDPGGPFAQGETPTIVAQVQGLAPPDTVAISSATKRLVEGYFVTQALVTYPLDGGPVPLVVFQVLQQRPIPSRLAVITAQGLTPFVGREVELALLHQRWAQVREGRGQMIVLSGEPGIGKSRLVQVLKDHVADEPHVRWECRSAPYYQNTALYPMTDLLQRALQWHRHDTPEQRVAKLEHVLSQYHLPLAETVPLFAPLLSLPIPTDTYPPLNLSPQRQRQKTLESIVAMLLELAAREPVLFILEDLQWTDPTTLELLGLLVEQAPASAICVLLTCRPEFQPSWHYRSYLTEITVDRLSQVQIAQMAQHVAGGKALSGDIIQQLVDKTDGVPLYVEEMTKACSNPAILRT
jgi:DNA-binding winged helix-turn-helix (wHTH) protein